MKPPPLIRPNAAFDRLLHTSPVPRTITAAYESLRPNQGAAPPPGGYSVLSGFGVSAPEPESKRRKSFVSSSLRQNVAGAETAAGVKTTAGVTEKVKTAITTSATATASATTTTTAAAVVEKPQKQQLPTPETSIIEVVIEGPPPQTTEYEKDVEMSTEVMEQVAADEKAPETPRYSARTIRDAKAKSQKQTPKKGVPKPQILTPQTKRKLRDEEAITNIRTDGPSTSTAEAVSGKRRKSAKGIVDTEFPIPTPQKPPKMPRKRRNKNVGANAEEATSPTVPSKSTSASVKDAETPAAPQKRHPATIQEHRDEAGTYTEAPPVVRTKPTSDSVKDVEISAAPRDEGAETHMEEVISEVRTKSTSASVKEAEISAAPQKNSPKVTGEHGDEEAGTYTEEAAPAGPTKSTNASINDAEVSAALQKLFGSSSKRGSEDMGTNAEEATPVVRAESASASVKGAEISVAPQESSPRAATEYGEEEEEEEEEEAGAHTEEAATAVRAKSTSRNVKDAETSATPRDEEAGTYVEESTPATCTKSMPMSTSVKDAEIFAAPQELPVASEDTGSNTEEVASATPQELPVASVEYGIDDIGTTVEEVASATSQELPMALEEYEIEDTGTNAEEAAPAVRTKSTSTSVKGAEISAGPQNEEAETHMEETTPATRSKSRSTSVKDTETSAAAPRDEEADTHMEEVTPETRTKSKSRSTNVKDTDASTAPQKLPKATRKRGNGDAGTNTEEETPTRRTNSTSASVNDVETSVVAPRDEGAEIHMEESTPATRTRSRSTSVKDTLPKSSRKRGNENAGTSVEVAPVKRRRSVRAVDTADPKPSLPRKGTATKQARKVILETPAPHRPTSVRQTRFNKKPADKPATAAPAVRKLASAAPATSKATQEPLEIPEPPLAPSSTVRSLRRRRDEIPETPQDKPKPRRAVSFLPSSCIVLSRFNVYALDHAIDR